MPLGLGKDTSGLPGPVPPLLPSRARPCSPVFASLFDFSHGTFQELESRGSAGQRAFVKRRAGEGHTRGSERRHPCPRGLRGLGLGLGSCVSPPRSCGRIPPRGP